MHDGALKLWTRTSAIRFRAMKAGTYMAALSWTYPADGLLALEMRNDRATRWA